ncbi:MAG TPA: hypothetical protein VGF48_09055 [Thermoanaerobaculia bacterium]|jgi:hypothetical protein
MIKITCTNCQKPLSLDETKLPADKEVAFPCPVCKTRLTVDRRNLAGAAPAAPVAAPVQEASAPDNDEDHENEFGAKAVIVGVDHPGVRQAAKLVGFLPVYYADPARARDFYMQETPQVVFIVPQQLTPPPLEAMSPIISLMPVDRRRSFFILVADGLRTLDGNAAFLYGVNLVVAAKDLGQFPQIYRETAAYHERFYSSMTNVLRAMQA